MATRRYVYLYNVGEEISIKGDILNAYKLFSDPYVYQNSGYDFELLMDGDIDPTNPDYENSSDYDQFFELIYKLMTDPAFISNQTYLSYGATNLQVDSDYIEFDRSGYEWKIYLTFDRLEDEYPAPDQFYVFYDEDDTINTNEIWTVLSTLCDELGKENKYTGVYEYVYNDGTTVQHFYVFYYGDPPTDEIAKIAIRNHLVQQLGYDEARNRYPNLFIDTYRNIYLLYELEGFPINVELLNNFVDDNNIFHPEVFTLLDWRNPLIAENGISDIVPNYAPIEISTEPNDNLFLFYLSTCLNYLDGTIITPEFRTEANFNETDDYVSFVYNGTEWRIQKWTYVPPSP